MGFEMHHHAIDRLALANGIVSGAALYPQVWSVLMSGSAAGISLVTFCIILLNSLVWLAYALHRGLISVGISSILNALASSILVASVLTLRA
jgi:uncharacterized protein with PQ loop repeat